MADGNRHRLLSDDLDPAPGGIAGAALGSVFVEPLATGVSDREPGRLVRHPPDRARMDQSVQRIGQGAVIQSGSRGRLKLLERHTGCTMLGS